MDKSMLGDLANMPEEDQQRMSNMIDQLQIKDRNLDCCMPTNLEIVNSVLRMYNSLVERCFNNCVDSFRRKTLDKQEETCVQRCAEKYLKHSMRVSMRFAELNQGSPTPD